jgi:preprotein translocase subunit YajC
VVLLNGIHGIIFRVNDNTFVVEIADRTRVTIDKTAVARKSGADTASDK